MTKSYIFPMKLDSAVFKKLNRQLSDVNLLTIVATNVFNY